MMAPKLIPLKLLSDGEDTVSFIGKGKSKACPVWLSKSILRDGLLNHARHDEVAPFSKSHRESTVHCSGLYQPQA